MHPLNKFKSGAFTLEFKREFPQNDHGNVAAMLRQCKSAINSEIGDKSGDKSAINSGIGDKSAIIWR